MAKNADPVYFAVLNFVRYCVFPPFGGVRVLHRERMPMEGSVIVAANHASFADPPVVAISTNRRLNFMAKAELFKPPIFGPLIRRIGAFPVHRGVADPAARRLWLVRRERSRLPVRANHQEASVERVVDS